ncbi:MAG: hypothetical protein IPO81_21135 [Kouleothrix sp.]|nr:hypothetical protein [Kouleothrix sp.]
MVDRGAETEDDRALRAWFAEQQGKNLDRLEEGAKTLAQLITGLYGVLFAILAFSANPTPAYLRDTTVRWLGSAALGALFVALLGTLAALYPRASRYQEHNLSAMRRAREGMRRVKVWSLRLALALFLVGMGCLGALIAWVLWTI